MQLRETGHVLWCLFGDGHERQGTESWVQRSLGRTGLWSVVLICLCGKVRFLRIPVEAPSPWSVECWAQQLIPGHMWSTACLSWEFWAQSEQRPDCCSCLPPGRVAHCWAGLEVLARQAEQQLPSLSSPSSADLRAVGFSHSPVHLDSLGLERGSPTNALGRSRMKWNLPGPQAAKLVRPTVAPRSSKAMQLWRIADQPEWQERQETTATTTPTPTQQIPISEDQKEAFQFVIT